MNDQGRIQGAWEVTQVIVLADEDAEDARRTGYWFCGGVAQTSLWMSGFMRGKLAVCLPQAPRVNPGAEAASGPLIS